MMRCFERWLHHIGMTETEKQECRRRAAQGFEQPAEIFCWEPPESSNVSCFVLWERGLPEGRAAAGWATGGSGFMNTKIRTTGSLNRGRSPLEKAA